MSRETSVRLGGMALANGVLVHGARHWSCAVRTDDGELKVASGLKPVRSADVKSRFVRGPARIAEIFALLPEVRRRLPEAKLPVQRPGVLGAMAGSIVAIQVVRRTRFSPLTQESLAESLESSSWEGCPFMIPRKLPRELQMSGSCPSKARP